MKFLLLGEHATGKSSLLVALYGALVNRRAGDARIVRTVDDVEFLSRGLQSLGRRESVNRTNLDCDDRLAIELEHAGAVAHIEVADRSGELLRDMLDSREWDSTLHAQIAEADGALLFLRADHLVAAAAGPAAPDPDDSDPFSTLPPWTPAQMPLDVRAVDLLQAVLELRAATLPVAVMLSAWDSLSGGPEAPSQLFAEHAALLAQLLETNSGQLPHAVFGVSAQGEDFDAQEPSEVARPDPWERSYLVRADGERGTLLEPVTWLVEHSATFARRGHGLTDAA